MNVAFWHKGKQFVSPVYDQTDRRYMVMLEGQKIQVAKYAATPVFVPGNRNASHAELDSPPVAGDREQNFTGSRCCLRGFIGFSHVGSHIQREPV